jgi:hypothetical protein
VAKRRSRTSAVIKIHSAEGRVVAGVRGDVLQKTITNRGMLRRPDAIAFDVVVLDQAERLGAAQISVTNTDTHQTYQCTIADFRAHGFAVNRGFGEQWALALNRWNTGADDAMRVAQPEPPPARRQLDLWGRRG